MKKFVIFALVAFSLITIAIKIQTSSQTIKCKHINLIFKLDEMSDSQLLYMRDAAKSLQAYQSQKNVVKQVQIGAKAIHAFDHYPKGDVLDSNTHYQYYYHSHRNQEHGHFHTFYMFPGKNESFTHLIAISMDKWGRAIKLFTVNQWVTGGKWLLKNQLHAKVRNFKVEKLQHSPINDWINPFFILFEPQINELISMRDEVIEKLKVQDSNILQNSKLDEITSMDISLDEQIKWLKLEFTKRQLEW